MIYRIQHIGCFLLWRHKFEGGAAGWKKTPAWWFCCGAAELSESFCYFLTNYPCGRHQVCESVKVCNAPMHDCIFTYCAKSCLSVCHLTLIWQEKCRNVTDGCFLQMNLSISRILFHFPIQPANFSWSQSHTVWLWWTVYWGRTTRDNILIWLWQHVFISC